MCNPPASSVPPFPSETRAKLHAHLPHSHTKEDGRLRLCQFRSLVLSRAAPQPKTPCPSSRRPLRLTRHLALLVGGALLATPALADGTLTLELPPSQAAQAAQAAKRAQQPPVVHTSVTPRTRRAGLSMRGNLPSRGGYRAERVVGTPRPVRSASAHLSLSRSPCPPPSPPSRQEPTSRCKRAWAHGMAC